MRMRDKDVGPGITPHRIKQRLYVARIVGTQIDDRHLPLADDISDRAREGEWPGIAGADRAHAGRDLFCLAGDEIEGLVERNVVGYAHRPAVVPAQAGTHTHLSRNLCIWVPA